MHPRLSHGIKNSSSIVSQPSQHTIWTVVYQVCTSHCRGAGSRPQGSATCRQTSRSVSAAGQAFPRPAERRTMAVITAVSCSLSSLEGPGPTPYFRMRKSGITHLAFEAKLRMRRRLCSFFAAFPIPGRICIVSEWQVALHLSPSQEIVVERKGALGTCCCSLDRLTNGCSNTTRTSRTGSCHACVCAVRLRR